MSDPGSGAGGDSLTDQKNTARAGAKKVRAEAHRACPDAGALAARLMLDLEGTHPLAQALAPGRVLAGYDPIRDEIDPMPLLTGAFERGTRLALPVIDPETRVLTFRAWEPGETLERHHFGTRAPVSDAPVVRPDALIVPMLAFDRFGGRLGYGQGHYDRTLAGLRRTGPVLAIGLAYADQEVACVPVDAHDVPMDWIITDRAVIETRPW